MAASSICILDYGSGNVKSVYNMLSSISKNVQISNDTKVLEAASHIILPGVGAFGSAMEKIHEYIPMEVLVERIFKNGIPFLGICVGMQVMAQLGFEFGEHPGLGWIPGKVERLVTGTLPLPHMGWNDILPKCTCSLLKDLPESPDFYFLHSFAFKEIPSDYIIATSNYGEDFPCIIAKDNIFGVQFHPEKSQEAGMTLMRNFIKIE